MSLEQVILSHLVLNVEFTRKAIPYIKEEYFQIQSEKTLFRIIKEYIDNYNKTPTKEALYIEAENLSDGITEESFKNLNELIDEISIDEETDLEFLLNQTETWCKDRAIYLGIMESINILDDKKGKLEKASIPQILTDALAVSFDSSIGHDYTDDFMDRYKSYHEKTDKIPFDIDLLNRATKGGVEKKTLNAVIGGTGAGKSLFLCHLAASYYASGKNVLYITMELSEKKVMERIDANLLDVNIEDLGILPLESFKKKIGRIKDKLPGKLKTKEYPTGTASAANFRHLINELKLKQNFVPDIIIIDYLNICASSRYKRASTDNYQYLKSVAEELRALGIEFDVPVWTAVQTNREGSVDSDFGMEKTAESFGIPQTLDFYLALITNDELYKLGQILIKQLKSRYDDLNKMPKFMVGIDRQKMRLYDVDGSAQEGIASQAISSESETKKGKFS